MSGVIPDSIITVSVPITSYGDTEPYRIISFPKRVQVTAVSFTVNAAAINPDRETYPLFYQLHAVKGHVARNPGYEYWDEDTVPFFGDNEKPNLTTDETTFHSTIAFPADKLEWSTYGESYTGDVAQMDTDEYLCVWVYAAGGDFGGAGIDSDETYATISIAYTGATNLN